jgi:ATP-dependent DNA helicase RecQ
MLKRDVPFEELEIDFEALEVRKAAEYDKLNRMVRFALSGACRQQEILHYFGESEAGVCHHCDNCAKHDRRDRTPRTQSTDTNAKPSPEILTADKLVVEQSVEEGVIEAVRIVLSGVARAESRIACGKNLIAQMLCGSNSAKIKKLRLNQLSTFGLLWQLKQAEVVTLIDLLIAMGCLEQENIDRFRPVLKLTPRGGDVMRGKAELPIGLKLPGELRLKLRRPAAKESSKPGATAKAAGIEQVMPSNDAANKSSAPTESCISPESCERSCRASDVPEYEGPPADDVWITGSIDDDPAEMRGLDLDMLAKTCFEKSENPLTANSTANPRLVEQKPLPVNRPSYYWTWRLLSQGFPADECQAIRGITREALLDHVIQAAESGLEIRAAWCLPAATITALDVAVGKNPSKQIRPLLAQLPPGTRYEEVQIYLKCRSL